MDTNSNTQQSQFISRRKAVIPLTLGVLSIAFSWLGVPAVIGKEWYGLAFIVFLITLASAIIGLISGIRDSRSKKELATLGMILCSIGALASVIIYFGSLVLKTH